MDLQKLSGIAEAIEAESKLPSPSHGNLARLTGMFFREIISIYAQGINPHDPREANFKDLYPNDAANIEEPKPKKRLKKQG